MASDEPASIDTEEEEPHNDVKIFYDVANSIKNIERWPEKKTGYRELGSFCVFMILYIVILSLQLQVGNSYQIDNAFRNFLSNGIDTVFTQDNFWDYLYQVDPSGAPGGGGILPILFNTQWYNGDAYTTQEQGYILDYNKLVGGVLIVQSRGVVTNDGCSQSLGGSSYEQYYPLCYQLDTATETYNKTYDESTYSSFQFSPDRGGYVAFFSVAEGRNKSLARAFSLKNDLWTDKATRAISIKFAFYNGNVGLFSFCAIDFTFDVGGIFTNGNMIRIQSINMEPYRGTAADSIRLLLEIIFMIWCSQQCVFLIRTSYIETQKINVATGVKYGLPVLVNLWTAVDVTNLALFFAYIGFRAQVLWTVYSNPISVPTNQYESVLEEVALIQNSQLVVNFLNIFIGLLRFFKFYQFQAKLNVLNKTFANAFVDLYHFIIMFSVIFGGYAVMGHILFGPSVHDYNSMGRSLQTCWQMILGQFDYSAIEYVNPDMAAIFFITFMFLVLIVLINILLAILIDAYTRATQDEDGMTILNEIGKGVVLGVNSLRGHNRHFNDKDIINALKRLQEKGNARVTANEIGTIISKSLQNQNIGVVSEIVSDHPFLDVVNIAATDNEQIKKMNGYPLELIDNIETVLRENAYLRHRVQADIEE